MWYYFIFTCVSISKVMNISVFGHNGSMRNGRSSKKTSKSKTESRQNLEFVVYEHAHDFFFCSNEIIARYETETRTHHLCCVEVTEPKKKHKRNEKKEENQKNHLCFSECENWTKLVKSSVNLNIIIAFIYNFLFRWYGINDFWHIISPRFKLVCCARVLIS